MSSGAAGAWSVRQDVRCPCGQFFWEYVMATTQLAAVHKQCPKCREHYLVILRQGTVDDVVRFEGGWDVESLARSLGRSDALSDAEITDLVTAAASTASRE